MITRRRALQIFAATSLMPSAAQSVDRRYALGADVAMTLSGAAEVTGPARLAAWQEIERLEAVFSLYDPRSDLSRLNANGSISSPRPEMIELLRLCAEIHSATDGLFDPTVQPLWQAHANGTSIEAALALVGFDRVTMSDREIRLDTGQALTLNGIAQGYITDRVTEVLRQHGLTHALVNIGEYRGLSGPWRLGIEDPVLGQIGQITLSDRAVATSSPAAMQLADGSAHIVDPTGRIAAPYWSTVAVTAASAAVADGLSTALCHAAPITCQETVNRLGQPVSVRLVDPQGNLTTL